MNKGIPSKAQWCSQDSHCQGLQATMNRNCGAEAKFCVVRWPFNNQCKWWGWNAYKFHKCRLEKKGARELYNAPDLRHELWLLGKKEVRAKQCLAAMKPIKKGTIKVGFATYGGNCRAPRRNATSHVAAQCNGRSSCRYTVSYRKLGDPAPGCAKSFVVTWRCGDKHYSHYIPAEAGFGKQVHMTCK